MNHWCTVAKKPFFFFFFLKSVACQPGDGVFVEVVVVVFFQTIVRTLASHSPHKNVLGGGGEMSSAAGRFCCHSGGIQKKKKERKSCWKMFLTKPKTLSAASNPIFPLLWRQTASQCAAARVISRTMLRNTPTTPTMRHTGS